MDLTQELENKGFNIDELNPEEKQTYFSMLETVQKAQLTPEKLKDYIVSMREAVSNDLATEPSFNRILIWKVENPKLIKLQARLQNYLLLEAFLESPAKAEQQLRSMIDLVGTKQA